MVMETKFARFPLNVAVFAFCGAFTATSEFNIHFLQMQTLDACLDYHGNANYTASDKPKLSLREMEILRGRVGME